MDKFSDLLREGVPHYRLLAGHTLLFILPILLLLWKLSHYRKHNVLRPVVDEGAPPMIPYTLPFLGSALSFKRDPLEFASLWSRRLGTGVFGAYMGGQSFLFVTDPFVAEQIIGGRFPSLSWRPSKFLIFRNVGGMFDGEDGDAARTITENRAHHGVLDRHLIKGLDDLIRDYQAALNGTVLPSLLRAAERVGCAGGEWKAHNILETFGGAIWRSSLVSLYGYSSMASDEAFKLALEYDAAVVGMYYTSTASRQKSSFPEGYRAREELLERVIDEYETHRAEGALTSYATDLTSMYRDRMSTESLCRYQLTNILAATTLNTIPTAFWVVYYLLAIPNAYAAVEKEVLSIFRERGGDSKSVVDDDDGGLVGDEHSFTLSELDRMTNLDSLVTETIRLKTTACTFRTREAERDCDITFQIDKGGAGGLRGEKKKISVKQGTKVLTCPTLLHRDVDVFEDASSFKWDRFLPDKDDGKPPVFAKGGRRLLRPVEAFGAGPTMCPGRKFARAEIKAVVSNVLIRYDTRFVGGKVPSPPRLRENSSASSSGMPGSDVPFELRKRVAGV